MRAEGRCGRGMRGSDSAHAPFASGISQADTIHPRPHATAIANSPLPPPLWGRVGRGGSGGRLRQPCDHTNSAACSNRTPPPHHRRDRRSPPRYLATLRKCIGDWAVFRRPRAGGDGIAYFAVGRISNQRRIKEGFGFDCTVETCRDHLIWSSQSGKSLFSCMVAFGIAMPVAKRLPFPKLASNFGTVNSTETSSATRKTPRR